MYSKINLEDLDQEQCWSYIMGTNIGVGKSYLYCSPIRTDNNPGCNFKWYQGSLFLMDGAGTNETCITAWMKIQGLSYWDAVKDLNWRVSHTTKYEPKVKKKEIKCVTSIDIKSYWRQEHEDYWNLRGLSRPHDVYGVISYTIERGCEKQTWYPDDLCFAYKHAEGKYKIYFPNRSKPRFLGNLKRSEVWWSLRGSDTVLVSKAHKDFLEWESLVDWDITMTQSEGVKKAPFEWETYKQLFLCYDSDLAGIKSALKILEQVQIPTTVILIPNLKSVDIVGDNPDIIKHLTPNLAAYYKHHLGYPVSTGLPNGYVEGKDLDEMIVRNKNYKQILKWILS